MVLRYQGTRALSVLSILLWKEVTLNCNDSWDQSRIVNMLTKLYNI